MKQEMNPESLYTEIKQRMNYKDDSETCGKCKYFEPDDMSGSLTAKGRHCTKNIVVKLPVDTTGHCDYFTKLATKSS